MVPNQHVHVTCVTQRVRVKNKIEELIEMLGFQKAKLGEMHENCLSKLTAHFWKQIAITGHAAWGRFYWSMGNQ